MLHVKNALYLGQVCEFTVKNGKIEAFASGTGNLQAEPGSEVLDAKAQILFPSLIDAHVHLRQPGQEWKEDIQSGLSAAAHGGVGRVLCMANTNPVNDNASVTRLIKDEADRTHPNGPYVYPMAAATLDLAGQQLAPLAELADAGCIAVSNDGVPLQDTALTRRVMEYANDLGLLFVDHCEDPWLAKGSHMNEGALSGKLGVKGQPDIAEALQVARDVMLSEYLNVPVHICHVSCAASLKVISRAKADGIRVTAETCPHYLLLDESALTDFSTLAKVNPPLRTPADVLAMREAVKTGLIDILVTDHAPHAAHEKDHPLDLAPNGMTGLDLSLSLLFELTRQGVLDQADLIRLYAWRPAEIFKLPCNRFQPGDPADFSLFDPQLAWLVSPETLYSKSSNTPWLGQTLQGRVTGHWLNGVKIV